MTPVPSRQSQSGKRGVTGGLGRTFLTQAMAGCASFWTAIAPVMKEQVVKLTTKGRYAVMAMADLARHSSGSPVALAEIADRQEISLSYLEQLFAKLRRGDLVKSVRGPGGGYLLSRDADQIRISDVILAVDEPIKATRCELGSPKGCLPSSGRCITHDLWEGLSHQIQLYLGSVSLGDVIEGRIAGRAGFDIRPQAEATISANAAD